jgi:hypothetical protein
MFQPDHDRRSSPRFKIKVPLEIYTEEGASPIRGNTADLNLSGCYIETVFPFPAGTRLEIKLQLDSTLLVLAIVVTCDPQVGNGIRFYRMLPEDFEALRAYLEAATAKPQ